MPREREPQAIARWLESDWPRIKKKARRQGACLVLIGESGLLMAPLLRRTWAPKAKTSMLRQPGAHRQKVSLCAALWLSADRQRLGLFCQRLVNGYL